MAAIQSNSFIRSSTTRFSAIIILYDSLKVTINWKTLSLIFIFCNPNSINALERINRAGVPIPKLQSFIFGFGIDVPVKRTFPCFKKKVLGMESSLNILSTSARNILSSRMALGNLLQSTTWTLKKMYFARKSWGSCHLTKFFLQPWVIEQQLWQQKQSCFSQLCVYHLFTFVRIHKVEKNLFHIPYRESGKDLFLILPIKANMTFIS